MKIVITGASGFLGSRLAFALLSRGTLCNREGQQQAIDKLVLFDHVTSTAIEELRVDSVAGDIANQALLCDIIGDDTDAVFHLAAVVSGEAEADFDLGMRVNFDGTRALLEACRELLLPPRLVFASSVAVFGIPLPQTVSDNTAPTPRASYGVQKLMGELMVSDYSRKGFIDGRAVRLPTIVVRPGKANKAASSFASGIMREPLNGVPGICPVSKDTHIWMMSPPCAIEALIHAFELPEEKWGTERALNLPGISVSVEHMVQALERIAGKEVAARVEYAPDPVIESIVSTWPAEFDTARARSLGFKGDSDFDTVLKSYIEDQGIRLDL